MEQRRLQRRLESSHKLRGREGVSIYSEPKGRQVVSLGSLESPPVMSAAGTGDPPPKSDSERRFPSHTPNRIIIRDF